MNRVTITARTHLPPVSRRVCSVARLAMPLVCCVALACSKDNSAVGPPVRASATAIDPLMIGDAGIDQSDSYLITTAVTRTTTSVESAEPFTDPVTRQQVTTLTFPEVVDTTRLEAGYDVSGVVRINEYHAGNDSGGAATRLQIVGNTATFYDVNGFVVHDTAGPILMDALGSMDNVIVTSSAILREDSVSLSSASGPSLALAAAGGEPAGPRVERRGDRLLETWSLDDPAGGVRGQRIRQFRKSGGEWVVLDERIHTRTEAGPVSFDVFETTTYPVVKWNTNDERDARRRARGVQRAPSSLSTRRVTDPLPSLFADHSANANDAARTEPMGTATDLACFLCADGGDGGVDLGLAGSGSINLAYQHGGFSDAGAWTRLDAYLSTHFNVANRVMPTLDWKQHIESQAAALTSAIVAKGGNRYLLIGHSNGGLVARKAAQNNAGSPLIGGVLAIATPHLGVPLVLNSRGTVNTLLTAYIRDVLVKIGGSCGLGRFTFLCASINDGLLTLVPRIVNYAFDFAAPVSGDVMPGGDFTRTLNGQPEPFLRYSVEVESQGAWKFIRMMGDWKCNPEDRCSGDHLQNAMESAYDVLRACGSNEFAKLLANGIADKCRNVRWSLSNLNQLYERLTSPGDASDGLIPAKSQAYPNAPAGRERVKNARESHVGELKGSAVHDRVRRIVTAYNTQVL